MSKIDMYAPKATPTSRLSGSGLSWLDEHEMRGDKAGLDPAVVDALRYGLRELAKNAGKHAKLAENAAHGVHLYMGVDLTGPKGAQAKPSQQALFLAVEPIGKSEADARAHLAKYGVNRRIRGLLLTRENFARDPRSPTVQFLVWDADSGKLAGDPNDPWAKILGSHGTVSDRLTATLRGMAIRSWTVWDVRGKTPAFDPKKRHGENLTAIATAAANAKRADRPTEILSAIELCADIGREARVYVLPDSAFIDVWNGVIEYTARAAWGIEALSNTDEPGWEHDGKLRDVVHEDAAKIAAERAEQRHALIERTTQFPDALPFESIAIMPERMLELGTIAAAHLGLAVIDIAEAARGVDGYLGVWLDAIWLRRDGTAVAMLAIATVGTSVVSYIPVFLRMPLPFVAEGAEPTPAHTWLAGCGILPWMIYALVAIVTDCREFVIDCSAEPKNDRKNRTPKNSKVFTSPAHLPQPLYRLTVSDRLIFAARRSVGQRLGLLDEDGNPVRSAVAWSHRWDVCAHERVYVRLGTMTPENVQALVKRGYRVYQPNEAIEAEDQNRLTARGFRSRNEGESIAVMHRWVRECVKGPENLPLVRALRVVEPRAE